MRFLSIAAALFCIWSSAAAAATVNEEMLQKGTFAKSPCQSDPKVPDYDDCTCDADIRYPQVSGISDTAVQEKLNTWFKGQAAKAICPGDKITPVKDAAAAAKAHMSVSVHYDTTFSSPQLLALKFTDWDYTGGAHGNGSIFGVIVDLASGRILTPVDIFSDKNMQAVNTAIYDVLAAKPEEEIFRDQIEGRKDAFIKDGKCDGCTLILTPEGVHVLFQTYEVAPYGAGNTDVLIPPQYIAYPAVAEALHKQSKPEKM